MSSLLILTALLALILAGFELRFLIFQCDHNTPKPMWVGSVLQAVGGAFFIINPTLCIAMIFTGRGLFLIFNQRKVNDDT